MSVPFSNTHLRVPRGFGTVLEGLAREVLRDQPDDIPAYAAQYFDKLRQQREESGMDPAEWAARLEDRFYNNQAFKVTETAGPEKEPLEEESGSKEESNESQTEDETSHSVGDTTLPIKRSPIQDKADLAKSTDDEENDDPTEELTFSYELQHREETTGADEQSDEQSSSDKEKEFSEVTSNQVNRPDNEDVNPAADCTQLDSDISNSSPATEMSNVGILEGGASENEREAQRDSSLENMEIAVSEGEEDGEEPEAVEMLQYSAPVNVEAFALENREERRTLEEGGYAAKEEETMKYQLEETDVELSPSKYKIPQRNCQEGEDPTKATNERETTATEASHEETSKGLDDLHNNATPKEDSLVETRFKDSPEHQYNTEVLEKDSSMEVTLTNISEMAQKDNLRELATDMGDIEDQHETEIEIIKKKDISEGEELQSQHTDTQEEKGETNNLDHSNDGEREIGGKTPKPESKINHDETIDKGYNETDDQEITNSRAIENPSQLIELDISVTRLVTENETLAENHEDLPEQNNQSPKVVQVSQSENVEQQEKEMANSEAQDQREETQKDGAITPTADRTAADIKEEKQGFEEDTTTIANKNDKQEECSRPQEEEDIMDIPLDDPEANRAAAKIQAGFRGHMTRKKMKPEDKTEGEEVSSTGDVLHNSQGGSETGRSGAVERDDTSVPEQ